MTFVPGSVALLFCEEGISSRVRKQRLDLIGHLKTIEVGNQLPILHYLQAQTGCFNSCAFCAQDPAHRVWRFGKEALLTVMSSLKSVALEREIALGRVLLSELDSKGRWLAGAAGRPIVAYHRPHRPGEVFCYLDDDPLSYPYLPEYVAIARTDLGVRTRITSVGFSRKNEVLCETNRRLSDLGEALGGFRLSVTPYTLGWIRHRGIPLPENDFALDLAHALKIFVPLKASLGVGRGRFCLEMRTKPLISRSDKDLETATLGGRWAVRSSSFTVVAAARPSICSPSQILGGQDPGLEAILLVGSHEIPLAELLSVAPDKRELEDGRDNLVQILGEPYVVGLRRLHQVNHDDGPYYTVGGLPDQQGRRREINLYPISERRSGSGVIYRARHFLNALIDYKATLGLAARDDMPLAMWSDVSDVLRMVEADAAMYVRAAPALARHITDDQLSIARLTAFALEQAGYPASDVLGYGFAWDTGAVTNLGRALNTIFGGLATQWYQPISVNEERGYGHGSQSAASKRGEILRIAPNPGSRAIGDVVGSKQLGFRNLGSTQVGGLVVELLDDHIQPIAGSRHEVPGVTVELVTSETKWRDHLVPGA